MLLLQLRTWEEVLRWFEHQVQWVNRSSYRTLRIRAWSRTWCKSSLRRSRCNISTVGSPLASDDASPRLHCVIERCGVRRLHLSHRLLWVCLHDSCRLLHHGVQLIAVHGSNAVEDSLLLRREHVNPIDLPDATDTFLRGQVRRSIESFENERCGDADCRNQ